MRRQGRVIHEQYMSTQERLMDSIATIIRLRLRMPLPPQPLSLETITVNKEDKLQVRELQFLNYIYFMQWCSTNRAHEGGISDIRHWTNFSIRHWHSTQNHCCPTPTLRIGDLTLGTPLQSDTDSLICMSTPDIMQNFESAPDIQTPLHGPYK